MKHRVRFMAAAAVGGFVAVGALAFHNVHSPTTCQARGELPDPACTPGALNPDVTQGTTGQTICVRGWTATVRPPVSYTDALKGTLMVRYGRSGPASGDELDQEAHVKDHLENRLRERVCAGTLDLATAQREIATDWVAAARAEGL